MRHFVEWAAPSPMWPDASAGADASTRRRLLRQPALLRFANDDFMDEFNGILTTEPASLGTRKATPEKWWKRQATPVAPARPAALPPKLHETKLSKLRRAARAAQTPAAPQPPTPSRDALKLFQPVHQRYYLVAGSLVCRIPGLPDHRVDPGRQERVTFVLRRLIPPGGRSAAASDPAGSEEYALVSDSSGTRWRRVPTATAPSSEILAAGEEQLPLFPANYTNEDGVKRRLFAGLIPVGRRDALMAVASDPELTQADGTPFPAPPGPRLTLLRSRVKYPWCEVRALRDRTQAQFDALDQLSATERANAEADRLKTRTNVRSQIQLISWYTLLDFADFLADHLPAVWAVLTGASPRTSLDAPSEEVVSQLERIRYRRGTTTTTLAEALVTIGQFRGALENETIPYDEDDTAETRWPTLEFPLAVLAHPSATLMFRNTNGVDVPIDDAHIRTLFETVIVAALPPEAPASTPAPVLASRPAVGLEEPWYVIRFVYERPTCGPVHAPVVSEATDPFQLAGFFDPDAPARPIRIGLPIDTSPAGLRKFNKNTAFIMSDILCGQFSRLRSMTFMDLVLSVLPWPFHKDLPGAETGPCGGANGFGLVCSLSIPIITICALIVLIIMVMLLDIIFKWLPYFIFCFPLPGFKAKDRLTS